MRLSVSVGGRLAAGYSGGGGFLAVEVTWRSGQPCGQGGHAEMNDGGRDSFTHRPGGRKRLGLQIYRNFREEQTKVQNVLQSGA